MKLLESQSLEFNWKQNTAKYPSINITIISSKRKGGKKSAFWRKAHR